MKTVIGFALASIALQVNAHPAHGLAMPHVHPSDIYLLVGLAVAVIGALVSFRIK